MTSETDVSSSSRLEVARPDLPGLTLYTLEPGQPSPGSPTLLRPPIAVHCGIGILTDFPSTTPFGLALGADSPCADCRCAGTLGFPVKEVFTPFSLLMSAFALRIPPATLTRHLHRLTERSPTMCLHTSAASVHGFLAPLHLPRKRTRPVSYYAFFKGWLLLSQPPGCLCPFTSFTTKP